MFENEQIISTEIVQCNLYGVEFPVKIVKYIDEDGDEQTEFEPVD